MRFLLGIIIGAALMYLFDPRQGEERREIWGERVRKGREQAESAVSTGKDKFQEAKDAARSRMGADRSDGEDAASEARSGLDDARESVTSAAKSEDGPNNL